MTNQSLNNKQRVVWKYFANLWLNMRNPPNDLESSHVPCLFFLINETFHILLVSISFSYRFIYVFGRFATETTFKIEHWVIKIEPSQKKKTKKSSVDLHYKSEKKKKTGELVLKSALNVCHSICLRSFFILLPVLLRDSCARVTLAWLFPVTFWRFPFAWSLLIFQAVSSKLFFSYS